MLAIAIFGIAAAHAARATACEVATVAALEEQRAADRIAVIERRLAELRAPGARSGPAAAGADGAALERAKLYEMRRGRDIRIILAVKRLAESNARPREAAAAPVFGPDGFLAAVLLEMRETMPVDALESDEHGSAACSLETALREASAHALGAVAGMPDFAEVKATLGRLVAKYGRPLEAAGMSAADRERFENELLPVIREAQVNTLLAADLIRLAHLEVASKLLWAAHREGRLGASIREWRIRANIDSDRTAAACALDVIDAEIPAQTAITAATMERAGPGQDTADRAPR